MKCGIARSHLTGQSHRERGFSRDAYLDGLERAATGCPE